MSNDEINIAVETALGFTVCLSDLQSGLDVVNDGDYRRPVRCYAESLDACAGLEKTLELRELADYSYKLMDITNTTYEAITASASQRCEAYLRMKGLWNERHA